MINSPKILKNQSSRDLEQKPKALVCTKYWIKTVIFYNGLFFSDNLAEQHGPDNHNHPRARVIPFVFFISR
ncbi:MAG: hypothetical protein CR994_03585 [Maribacter sp.]|nr:MAG: hypothetical protein CR994_03585 [Maribacter sp.]